MKSEAMNNTHSFKVSVTWTGNQGRGTASYTSYERCHEISGDGKPVIAGSSDPAFGRQVTIQPEELLIASSPPVTCLVATSCADAHLIVTEYADNADVMMAITKDGGVHFTECTLKPCGHGAKGSDLALAKELHGKAHHLLFYR